MGFQNVLFFLVIFSLFGISLFPVYTSLSHGSVEFYNLFDLFVALSQGKMGL